VAKLRSLGYSMLRVKSAAEPGEELPDPKENLEVFRRVKEAERLLVGDPAAAIVRLEAVVSRYPEVLRARELLALALEDEGRWVEAKSVYEALLEEYPASSQVMLQLAVVCGHLDDPGRGIALLESAVSLDPGNFLVHYHLGVVQSQTGQLKEASDSYRESIRLQPEYAKSHYGLGQVLIKEQKISDAQSHFQRAVELDARFKEAYHNLGLCLALQGNLEGAVISWKRALEIDPSYASSRKNLIQALEDLGRTEEAARLK
jgi:tetratricopeptide (TPR) repeat protein